YTRMLHDRVLQTLEMLAKGDWLADRDIRSLVMAEAAWLRGGVAGESPDRPDNLLAGLQAVVRDQARRGIHVELNDSALRAARRRDLVPARVAEAVCGAVGEAVTNASKHAGVDEVVVRAVLDPRDRALRVSIVDHGRGFDPTVVVPGTGLARSVRGRMAAVGGTVRVDSAPGRGTEVELSVPLPDPLWAGRPGALGRVVVVQLQPLPAGSLRAQPVAEGVPVVRGLRRPAQLGDGRQPWEGHVLDVGAGDDRLCPQWSLDAEHRRRRYPRD